MEFDLTNEIDLHVYSAQETKRDVIADILDKRRDELNDDSFFLADVGELIRNYNRWFHLLPRVKPYYAVKTNPTLPVLRSLAQLGVNFDCASQGEIETILNLGVPADRIILANTCKIPSHLRYAKQHGVDFMTFDSEYELNKIKNIHPDAKLLIRIAPPKGFKAMFDLSTKFGCTVSESEHLLRLAKSTGLDVVGVCFHVGSSSNDANAFPATVELANEVFKIGEKMGFQFDILDVGGGFYGHAEAPVPFEQAAGVLRKSLEHHFPPSRNVRLIAEPGRYFVDTAFTLVTSIIGKKERRRSSSVDKCIEDLLLNEKKEFTYTLTDGFFGNCADVFLNQEHTTVGTIKKNSSSKKYKSSFWGPTCDSGDILKGTVDLPEMEIGDVLYFNNMGAYSIVQATNFNGMPSAQLHKICSDEYINIFMQ